MNSIELMTITPEQAQMWLDATKVNRKIKQTVVDGIAKDITNNEWCKSASMIQIGINGECVDGNHRLNAIVKAGKPVEAYVLFGALPSSKIDTGNRRNISDTMIMCGYAVPGDVLVNKNTISAINYIQRLVTGDKRADADANRAYYIAHRDSIDEVIRIIHTKDGGSTRKVGVRSSPVIVAMIAALEGGVAKEVLKEWYTILATGYYGDAVERSVTAAKSIIHLSNALEMGNSRHTTNNTVMLKKAMSSIRHYNNDMPIAKLYGEMAYDIPTEGFEGQLTIEEAVCE